MCQGFTHFLVFLHYFVLAKLATSSIRVKLYQSPANAALSHIIPCCYCCMISGWPSPYSHKQTKLKAQPLGGPSLHVVPKISACPSKCVHALLIHTNKQNSALQTLGGTSLIAGWSYYCTFDCLLSPSCDLGLSGGFPVSSTSYNRLVTPGLVEIWQKK